MKSRAVEYEALLTPIALRSHVVGATMEVG